MAAVVLPLWSANAIERRGVRRQLRLCRVAFRNASGEVPVEGDHIALLAIQPSEQRGKQQSATTRAHPSHYGVSLLQSLHGHRRDGTIRTIHEGLRRWFTECPLCGPGLPARTGPLSRCCCCWRPWQQRLKMPVLPFGAGCLLRRRRSEGTTRIRPAAPAAMEAIFTQLTPRQWISPGRPFAPSGMERSCKSVSRRYAIRCRRGMRIRWATRRTWTSWLSFFSPTSFQQGIRS